MTAPLIDPETVAELAPACEQCARPASAVATYDFRGVLASLPPRHVLLCAGHAHELAVHQVTCSECPGMWDLRVEPLDGRRR